MGVYRWHFAPKDITFLRFCFEQDVIPRRVGIEEVFCPNLLHS